MLFCCKVQLILFLHDVMRVGRPKSKGSASGKAACLISALQQLLWDISCKAEHKQVSYAMHKLMTQDSDCQGAEYQGF